MPALRVGRAEIHYELRRSSNALHRKITVTPGCVEVTALSTDDEEAIQKFLNRKRRWVFDTVQTMKRHTAQRHSVPRLMTGSKIPFRGRKMPLVVRRTDADKTQVTYRNGFVVDLPAWVSDETDQIVASELKLWLKQRVRRDVGEIASSYARRFGIEPRSIRTADFAGGWGSCGPEGNILVNWQLIFAPRKVLEYVVVHELAHLRKRSHGPSFWGFVATMMPAFEESKAWLDQHQQTLTANFLVRPMIKISTSTKGSYSG